MATAASIPAHRVESVSEEGTTQFLQRPEIYVDGTAHVECIETHTSWVFLTHRWAFKLKKPVRFEFLDFSSLTLREQACREELRINRRLAPNVYIDVVPITVRGHQLKLGPPGQVVDWVVKMRRLPADQALDRLIKLRSVKNSDVEWIAQTLSEFYQQLPPVPLKTDDYLENIARHVRGNEVELLQARHDLDAESVERVHEAQRLLLALAPEILESRVLDGRIVEGHGDLRPEHVYLTLQPVIIDGIEFNREYRILDVADELSFFAMECAKLDAAWIGQHVLDRYRACAGDNPPATLIAFYKAYRACVRAKVSALRAEQLAGQPTRDALADARRYLNLASEFARGIGPPLMIVIRGRSGTGKSTLATAIAERLGITRLQTDVIRRQIQAASGQEPAYGQARYDMDSRQLVYNDMLRRADAILSQGRSVVLDGTFLLAGWRAQALDVARRCDALPAFFRCECPDEVALARIAQRAARGGEASEARAEVFQQQATNEEPDPAQIESIVVDTMAPLPEMLDGAIAELKLAFNNN